MVVCLFLTYQKHKHQMSDILFFLLFYGFYSAVEKILLYECFLMKSLLNLIRLQKIAMSFQLKIIKEIAIKFNRKCCKCVQRKLPISNWLIILQWKLTILCLIRNSKIKNSCYMDDTNIKCILILHDKLIMVSSKTISQCWISNKTFFINKWIPSCWPFGFSQNHGDSN